MHKNIQDQLIRLNHDFYNAFADSFSATRSKLQNGVIQLADSIPREVSILDLGCGNGQFLKHLVRHGFYGKYIGMDFSAGLLAKAEDLSNPFNWIDKTYLQTDLTNSEWTNPLSAQTFDITTAFAVLHHIPGKDLRQQLLNQVYSLLSPNGSFLFSVWQFQNSPRLRKRVLGWETIGLRSEDVEVGDVLLDWRAETKNDQYGLRYVHLFSEAELSTLRDKSGFTLKDEFYSDGKQGNLALYQVWQKH